MHHSNQIKIILLSNLHENTTKYWLNFLNYAMFWLFLGSLNGENAREDDPAKIHINSPPLPVMHIFSIHLKCSSCLQTPETVLQWRQIVYRK